MIGPGQMQHIFSLKSKARNFPLRFLSHSEDSTRTLGKTEDKETGAQCLAHPSPQHNSSSCLASVSSSSSRLIDQADTKLPTKHQRLGLPVFISGSHGLSRSLRSVKTLTTLQSEAHTPADTHLDSNPNQSKTHGSSDKRYKVFKFMAQEQKNRLLTHFDSGPSFCTNSRILSLRLDACSGASGPLHRTVSCTSSDASKPSNRDRSHSLPSVMIEEQIVSCFRHQDDGVPNIG
jgi:hypothetical protein